MKSTSETLKADGKLRVSLTQIIVVFLNLAPLHDLDGWLSSTSPGSYVNMMLCSLSFLRTSVDLLRTVLLVDEPSIVPSRTMVSVTVLHGLTLHTLTYTPLTHSLHRIPAICCFVLLICAEVFFEV
ncbi:hypothetical protein ATANTOWER_006716 [Ataeniobius toweri]|uniref:Uncharacterized protein n=1 Tax=Ataeniobius toweri TaxID=208326 RepID=A0ABU7B542_9TELE|nr:hypothetical protein [Ataeniobius toweri]